MSYARPLFMNEASTAKFLDLKIGRFRELVRSGCLPAGREIAPGEVRWDAEELRAVLRGDVAGGMGDVKW